MSDRIWTTKDGEEIAIEDMDDRHLLNAHQWVCNYLEEVQVMRATSCSVFAPRVGTIAEEHFEQAMDEMEEKEPMLRTWKSWFEDEIVMRDLKPLKHKKAKRIPKAELSKAIVVDGREIGTIHKLAEGDE